MIDINLPLNQTPFCIFFSGVEPERYFEITTKETNTLLMSYHYFSRKGKKFVQDRFEKCPNLKLIIDSGAHTFIQKEDEYRKKPLEFWEKYLEGYVKWARENRDHVFAVVELDIDYIVGEDKVEEWREKYFEPLRADGIEVIYVWHTIRGEANWETMCQKYPYVGFSLQGDKDLTVDKCMRMANTARKYGSRIHG